MLRDLWRKHCFRTKLPQTTASNFYNFFYGSKKFFRSVFGIVEISRQKIMTCLAYSQEINLCFDEAARRLTDFGGSSLACHLIAQTFSFCRKNWIRKYG